jgi:phosphatidylglycerol:prolipoprotein diacylglycerol transferase
LSFPEIDPVAVSIGPLTVRWYALAYVAGFVLGWRYAMRLAGRDPEHRPEARDIDDMLPWCVLSVIVGGRLGYVLFYNLAYYMREPWDILAVWQGGMAFHGGLAGVIICFVIFARRRAIPILRLGDIIACATPIGLFFGRIANFINGELFGRPAPDLAWAVTFPRGGDIPRHPSQLYEAGLEGIVLFCVLYILARRPAIRNTPGLLGGLFLSLYAVFRFVVEFYRAPDPQLGFVLGPFTMGQLLSVPMLVAGLAVAGYGLIKQRRTGTAGHV